MKPTIAFEVLDWADDVHVLKVRLFGTGNAGQAIDQTITLSEPMTISEVHELITKVNNGRFRSP